MKLTEEQRKGQRILFKIISEAWENESFKKALIDNPEETISNFLGQKIPFNKKIIVTDQSNQDYLYINIPVKPHNKDVDDHLFNE